MKTVAEEELREFLAREGFEVAYSRSGIGKELFFRESARRTIIVHFAADEPDDYVAAVATRVVDLADQWLLIPRYGSVAELGLLDGPVEASAISFEEGEQAQLVEYLCTRSMAPESASLDLYAVSQGGDILVTWDHHTSEEGLGVQLRRVDAASRLLVALNELGAELELYFIDG